MTQRLLAAVVVLPAVLVLPAYGSRSSSAQPAHTPSITIGHHPHGLRTASSITGPDPHHPRCPGRVGCAGGTVFGTDNVPLYGKSITAGVLRCESAEWGITCRDTKTGHGFSTSREACQLF